MTFTLLPEFAYLFMLMFARLGTMMMLMPGFGEQGIPSRVRLILALFLVLILYPMMAPTYTGLPDSLVAASFAIFRELLIGLFIGGAGRLIMSVAQIAGTTIAFQSGLAFAQSLDPSQGVQGALVGNFIGVLAMTLIFTLNLHHMVIVALHDSYELFPPGSALPVGDASEYAVMMISKSFYVGVQLATPFLAFGIIFNAGLGILARLMPQIQIFFIAMPANIMIGFVLLLVLIGGIMQWYMNHIESSLSYFIAN